MEPAFYYLSRETDLSVSYTPLLSIKVNTYALLKSSSSSRGEQNQALIIYPGRADLNAIFTLLLSIKEDTYSLLRLFSSSQGERNQAVIIYPGGADLNVLCFYHLSRKSKLHTVWTIKPIIKTKVTYLLWPTNSTTTPNLRNPRNPRNLPEKRSKKSVPLNQNIIIYLKRADLNTLFIPWLSIPGKQITYWIGDQANH